MSVLADSPEQEAEGKGLKPPGKGEQVDTQRQNLRTDNWIRPDLSAQLAARLPESLLGPVEHSPPYTRCCCSCVASVLTASPQCARDSFQLARLLLPTGPRLPRPLRPGGQRDGAAQGARQAALHLLTHSAYLSQVPPQYQDREKLIVHI